MKDFKKQDKPNRKPKNHKADSASRDQLINQAINLHLQGNISEAIKYYNYCLTNNFNDPRVFANYGIILKNFGKSKEAEIAQRKAIELSPDYPEAHANLGVILKDLGKLQEAEISTRRAIELNPEFANAHSNLGIILSNLGNLEEAEISQRKAIELNPEFANDHSNLGNILRDLGKLKEAELSTRKAIELNPDYPEAHANLGNILRDLGKLKEAELSTRKAIKINPEFANAHSNLGIILSDLGKFEEAELSTRKAIELNPDFADAYYNLGGISRDLGKLKEAELSTRKAIKINPNFADAHSNLGIILKDLGKFEEAKIEWIKAIELNPELELANFLLAEQLYLEKKYVIAINYLKGKKHNRSSSLYLGCLLCLDLQKEFNKHYLEISSKKICNAEIGGIIEHANIIYKNEYKSTFCNEAVKYILWDKINEDLFSKDDCNQLISYLKSEATIMRSQKLLQEGMQTSGNLFTLDYPFINSIKKALELKIELYKTKFKDSEQGFITNWPIDYELRSWIITMKSGGFLKQHNHEYGWITGSYYLQLPKSDNNSDDGNISFSYEGPQYPSKGKSFNSTIKKIETRDICIFPSSLFHHTIPFKSTDERICLVFDLVEKHHN